MIALVGLVTIPPLASWGVLSLLKNGEIQSYNLLPIKSPTNPPIKLEAPIIMGAAANPTPKVPPANAAAPAVPIAPPIPCPIPAPTADAAAFPSGSLKINVLIAKSMTGPIMGIFPRALDTPLPNTFCVVLIPNAFVFLPNCCNAVLCIFLGRFFRPSSPNLLMKASLPYFLKYLS